MSSEEDRIEQEAFNWMILLQEDPGDDASNASFEAWCSADLRHEKAWDAIMQTTVALRTTSEMFPHPGKIGYRPPSFLHTNFATIMGGAIAACIMLFLFLPSITIYLSADEITGTGETRQLTLADGSLVLLAAGSAVDIDYQSGERRVTLLFGQAFFNVEPNRSRPFKVIFRDGETTVLGTAFEVRMSPSGAAVTVEHGSVSVKIPGEDRQAAESSEDNLKAGDSLRMGWSGSVEYRKVKPEKIATWRTGKLEVQDRPVIDVIDELKRHYSGLVIDGLTQFAGRRITGVYDLSDPLLALRIIATTHGAHVRQISPWLVVISPI